MKNLIPEKAKLHIFKTNILLHLTYCSIVWHFIRSSDKRKLERLQEKGLRAVFKDKCSTYEDLLNKAKLPTLYNQRLQNIATLMFKVKHGICPTYISDLCISLYIKVSPLSYVWVLWMTLQPSSFITPS